MSSKISYMKLNILIPAMILALSLLSCKSHKVPKTLTTNHFVNDTIIRHEVESIVLPTRNYVIIENPCKDSILDLPKQIIKNETSTITIAQKDDAIHFKVDIDSIVNARLTETRIKNEVEKIEIPVEVPYPVKNKLNLYLVFYSIGATIVVFRKPIWFLIRKLIMPIP